MAITMLTEKLAIPEFIYADTAAISEESFKALAGDAATAEARRERGILATVGRCVFAVRCVGCCLGCLTVLAAAFARCCGGSSRQRGAV
jgi:hypothetical protein